MTNPIRSSFIISHAFRRFFVASVLVSIVRMLNSLIDGIIVGQTLGPDAISVVNMSTPIILITMLTTTVIFKGAAMIMANEIGNQNYKQVDRIFIMVVSFVFVLNAIFAIVLYPSTGIISDLLTSNERLLPMLNDYLSISFLGNIIFATQMTLSQFIRVSGKPGLVTKSLIIQTIINIAFDLLFVVVFDMGMKGAALASIVSYLCSIYVYVLYLRSEQRPFKLVRVNGEWCRKLLCNSIVRGFPIAIETIMMSVLFMGLNAIIPKSQGADGLFIVSVCFQLQTICLFISGGAGDSIIGIGGVFLGEHDYQGTRLLVNKAFRIILMGMFAFSVIVFVFPSLFARLFGAQGDLIEMTIEPLRIFCFIFIPIGLTRSLSGLFMILNRNLVSYMINIGMVVCMLSLSWLASRFAPEYIWYAMPVGMWLLLLITMVVTWIISRRNKGLHWFYLMQTSACRHWVTYSVNYQTDDVGKKLSELLGFVDRCNLSRKLHMNIQHCLEELMYNEVEMASLTKKKGTFDISVNNQEDKISVIIKDVGKPYNPTIKYIPNHIDDVDESQLAMLVVHSLCKNVTYKYMNGVNCIYLNFEKNK